MLGEQLAQAVTIQRSSEAAAAVREANDLTNELLQANAANLRATLQLRPDYAPARLRLGELLFKTGQPAAARLRPPASAAASGRAPS